MLDEFTRHITQQLLRNCKQMMNGFLQEDSSIRRARASEREKFSHEDTLYVVDCQEIVAETSYVFGEGMPTRIQFTSKEGMATSINTLLLLRIRYDFLSLRTIKCYFTRQLIQSSCSHKCIHCQQIVIHWVDLCTKPCPNQSRSSHSNLLWV